jgi:spore germination protein YaaH
VKGSINAVVKPKESVYVLQSRDGWTLIQKKNGKYGYIQSDSLSSSKTLPKTVVKKSEKKTPTIKGNINLVWELIAEGKIDTASIPAMEGVNVVSPTWYSLADGDGNVKSIADLDYVNWAHSRGYQVWGLFSNDFDPSITKQMLHNFNARQNTIQQMLSFATQHQLDGINLDFENVHTEEKESLIQFVRELTPAFHEKGLFVSIDVTPISSSEMWSNFLNREALGETVDYMALMAYDEHWETSPKSGSVASLPWTEQSITNLVGQVPHEKIILGMPTYTRMWKEENGKVSSDVFAMMDTRNWLISHNLRPTEDSKTGQNYVEIKEGNATYKIWIEDHKSLTKRAELVHKYDLAGIGIWERKYTLNETWTVINDALNN